MKNQFIKLTACILGLLWLAGCSSVKLNNAERTQAYQQFIADNNLQRVKKVNLFRLNSWNYLSDEYVILSSHISKPYLIGLSGPCRDLKFAHSIELQNTGSQLSEKFDAIMVPESPYLKCFIQSIYPLTREQANHLTSLGTMEKDNVG